MGGKAPATQTQTNKVELSPEQQQLFNLAVPYAQQYASQPLTSYGGQTIAGFTPMEQQAQQQYVTQGAPAAGQLGAQAGASQSMMLDPAQLSPDSNPYISQIADQITGKIGSNLTQNILPNIRAEGIQQGGMYSGGSTRQLMSESLASTGAVKEMGDALNNLYFNNYNAGINNISRAIGQNPSAQTQQLFGTDVLSMVGGQERAMEQARMDEALKQWTIQQQLPYMRSSELMSMITGMPGGTGVTTMNGASPRTSPVMGALGGAASGAAAGSMLMPGVGTAVGAALGGLGGYFTNR
jgi:hypothetical protein